MRNLHRPAARILQEFVPAGAQGRAMTPSSARAVFERSELPLPDRREGKVRESYALPDRRRLFITTDRLSAFDRILGCVPYKGQVLNQLAAWWFERTREVIPNHMLALPDPNALVALEAEPLPVEIVVRGYITGVTSTSLWHRYELGEREIYGHRFPEGLRKNQRLSAPVVTPTTKGGPSGHDERLTAEQVIERLPLRVWEKARDAALGLFALGQELCSRQGLLLVDSKYEFGIRDGEVILIDEVHTPDSSRFWTAQSYDGRLQPESLDKEFVRLAFAAQGYRGEGPVPEMPDSLWEQASQLYVRVYETITGARFQPGEYPVEPRLQANLRGLL